MAVLQITLRIARTVAVIDFNDPSPFSSLNRPNCIGTVLDVRTHGMALRDGQQTDRRENIVHTSGALIVIRPLIEFEGTIRNGLGKSGIN